MDVHNIELLVDLKLECGENPIYVEDENAIYFIDSGNFGIYRYDLFQQTCSKPLKDSITTSLTIHESNGLIFGTPQGLGYYDLEKGEYKMVDTGIELVNLNDAIADPAGRIFVGQESYSDDNPEKLGVLFRINLDGTVDIVEEGLSISNGMGFSPDKSIFYLVDSIPRCIYAYDYEINSGAIKNKRLLRKFDKNDGLPDGMTVDSEGFLWVALWFGSAIVRLDPDGNIIDKLKLPFSQPTSLTFGGKERSKIFLTSAGTYWPTTLAPANHDHTMTRGGALWRIDTDIQGLPEYKSAITIN